MRSISAILFALLFSGALFAGTRYGIFIGKNNGGTKKPVLKYAHRDARQLYNTLVEIGNLKAENAIVLLEPDIKTLRRNLQKFSRTVAGAKDSAREVFFYYSGHSDERGLLIENSVLDFAELKKWIHELPSEVNIVILDSCSSGSLARIKGGNKVPSAVLSESVNHRGTAILASSSSSEDSQESDQLRGSYFTHNLIAGLRGAADLNRDSRVSLHEAYTYSYEETLANTLESRAGPQHPFFDFKVSGYGDLPVSDLKNSGSQLVFGTGIEGKIYIFDNNKHLGLKLNKTSNRPLTVRLPPDQFQIRIFQDKSILNADVTLKNNESKELEIKHFTALSVDIQNPVKERYNSDFFLAGVFGPSFHFFMPSAGTLRNIDLADLGLTARVMAGIKLKTETALYLTGAVSGVSNLTKASGVEPLILNAGVGARYHFHPSGFFIGGSLNAAWNRITVNGNFGSGPETLTYVSKIGFGIELNAGMEWKIARDLGIGVSWFSYFGAVYGAAGSDPRLYADNVQNVVIGFMVSLTFF
jgi:hypothetical protein